MDIRGKSVLILGGYGLVGQAVALRLLQEGPRRLILLSLRREEAQEAVRVVAPEARGATIDAAWGDVTLIVHTDDGIMEFGGPVPAGEVGRGYYNVPGSKGFHGHLRHERCAGIAFVERPFMGRLSASVLFLNTDGGIMFKVFVGRDEKRELKADQLRQFRQLADRLCD